MLFCQCADFSSEVLAIVVTYSHFFLDASRFNVLIVWLIPIFVVMVASHPLVGMYDIDVSVFSFLGYVYTSGLQLQRLPS